ncbi:MAG: hypothetical protein ACJ72N_06945 [Labedaea sp.]
MSTGQCVICTRDNPTSHVCDRCVTQLVADLRTLAWLAAELMVTRTRQARLAGASGGSGAESPLGYHVAAARAYDRLHNALTTCVRDWWRTAEPWPANTPASMVAWLIARVDRVRRDAGADHLAIELEQHTKAALEIINPLDPNEQTYGICGAEQQDGTICVAYLYGEPKASWVRCRRCQTQHDTRRRVDELERRMHVLYFRAATLARLLPRLIERPVSANNIRSWAFQGRPIRTGLDAAGWVTYHTGDVIAVASVTPTRSRQASRELEER